MNTALQAGQAHQRTSVSALSRKAALKLFQWIFALFCIFAATAAYAQNATATLVVGGGSGGDGGLAKNAYLYSVNGFVFNSAGDMFIGSSNRVRKVTNSTGIISTVAGNGESRHSTESPAPLPGDGGPAIAAPLGMAGYLILDLSENLLFVDMQFIRKVNLQTGVLTTIAGNGHWDFVADGSPALQTAMDQYGMAVDRSGNLYFSDWGIRVRKISAQTAIVTTVAGTGVHGFAGDGGPATSATIAGLYIAMDSRNNLYISDASNNRIRKVDAITGIISTFAGGNVSGSSGDGGLASYALLNTPRGIAFDSGDNLYIADSSNYRIRKVDAATGIISTVISGHYARELALTKSDVLYASSGDRIYRIDPPMPASPPTVPVFPSATAGNTQATVGFTQPASNGGGAIQSYTVTANPGGRTATGSASPITVTGLTNGTSYTFTVTANNSAGSSPVSSISNAVVPGPVVVSTPNGTFAYITHFGSNYVSVIDVPTNTVVSTITVGQSPEALAIQPGGSKVYVGNFSTNNVSVINTSTMAQVGQIAVGRGPRGLTVAPDGSRLYVANNTSGSVSVINTDTLELLNTINVESSPWGVVVTPDSHKVYVANLGGNSVSVINAASNLVTKTIRVGYTPFGLAMAPDGSKVYVANFDSNTVAVINTATDTVVASIIVGNGPFGLALSPNGATLYVTTNLNTVSVVNTATNTVVATIPVGNHPQGISVTSDGSKVYVANYVGNTLSVIDAASNTVSASIPMANGPVAFGNFIAASNVNPVVIEFYNTPLDSYFITADVNEAMAIDNGSAGPGWIRTGNSFKSGGSNAVCRFYGSQSPGPNSHFYTVIASECQGLKAQQFALNDPRRLSVKNWNFESYDFLSTVPVMPSSGGNLTCPSGLMPIYRAYNNGSARGIDSNHRITSSVTAIQQVLARGWVDEGIVMCAPQ